MVLNFSGAADPMIKILVYCLFWSVVNKSFPWQKIHGWIFNTVATDILVLKHQAICDHSADQISILYFQNV